MRSLSIFSILMLTLSSGCYSSCPGYGPGFGRSPYNSCIGNNKLASPVPLCAHGSDHKASIAERKQQRELRKWYRELNDAPSQSHGGDVCPHCSRRMRSRRPSRNEMGHYDEFGYDDMAYYDDGFAMDGGYYDGQIIDGAVMDGGVYNGTYSSDYCPDCQNNGSIQSYPMHSEPAYAPTSEPTVAPAPPTEPTPVPAAAPGDSSALRAPASEYYSPAPVTQPTQPVSIPPVDQILYAPPIQK